MSYHPGSPVFPLKEGKTKTLNFLSFRKIGPFCGTILAIDLHLVLISMLLIWKYLGFPTEPSLHVEVNNLNQQQLQQTSKNAHALCIGAFERGLSFGPCYMTSTDFKTNFHLFLQNVCNVCPQKGGFGVFFTLCVT